MRKQDLEEIKDWTFYKIVHVVCRTPIYTGRTTPALWYDRKRNHRLRADDPDRYSNAYKVHRYMHAHGGRDAFDFVVIKETTCSRRLAESMERDFIGELGSDLNVNKR